MTKRVVIVGAGPGGLATAIQLAQAGVDVAIVERQPHVGGGTSTFFEAQGVYEANAVVLNADFAHAMMSLVPNAPRRRAAYRFRQSWIGAVLHPCGMIVLLSIQWYACLRALRGQPATWKGRAYRPSHDVVIS